MNSVGSKIEARLPGEGGAVAIIGMACVFPGAPNLDTYWQNIVSGVDAIAEVPPGRWDPEVFFDPDSTADDRLYCKRGGYLRGEAWFDPLAYGIMPIVLTGGEPDQFLSLRVASEALADAGYKTRPFNRERTEIILGRGNYSNRGNLSLAQHTIGIEQTLQILRSLHPEYTTEELETIKRELKASLPHLGPDTAGALIPNLTTGRVANRLDLMGANFTVDAACASALIAVDLAARDLLTGRCDLALIGGVQLATHVPFLVVFTQINALSRRSQIRPFDVNADGTIPGEGVGVAVLKRREEAERDGDRIYAVIKGVGISSDGRGQGLLAPRVEGEELALRRAYEAAGISPRTIELIEAHGTGTPVGDLAEMEALSRVFGPRKGLLPTCAVGTIKSMIGHLMPAAGIAGLIKAALALHHKALPPTLHCETPNPKFELEKSPFYINTVTRPWIHGAEDAPRRAGVSSFGFGGINAHVILEEYPSRAAGGGSGGPIHWESEVCLVQGSSRQDLVEQARRLEGYLDAFPQIPLKDLAYTLNTELREGSARLALVADSVEDLRRKLVQSRERLADPACRQIKDMKGVYFFEAPLRRHGKLAFLSPGETSQYPNMLKDLCFHFPEVRDAFDRTDQIHIKAGRPLLPSQYIFPFSGASDLERQEMERNLWEMGGAHAAILTANWALHTLLRRLEIHPDILLGHSSGEYSALAASGILADDAILRERLPELLSPRLTAEGMTPEVALAAVGADRAFVTSLLQEFGSELSIAMDNCPHQVVIVGKQDAVAGVISNLRANGVVCQRLPFDRAYHTPMFASVTQPLREFFQELVFSPPEVEIYSSATMSPYPLDPQEVRELVAGLWSRPVEFTKSIEALYDAGVRIFVEVGPRGNLTAFVEDILRGRPHLAIPCDLPHRSAITQLNHLIGLLAAHSVSMRLDYLYDLRSPRRLSLDKPASAAKGSTAQPLFPSLPLDLPMMRLSPEGARLLRPRSLSPVGQAELRFVESEPALLSLPYDERLAVLKEDRPQGADHAGTLQPSLGVASEIMHEHLQTMERFLAVEREVMETFLDGAGAAAALETAAPAVTDTPVFPFIGEVISLTPGREVFVRRRIDLSEDIFLLDHVFGGRVSDVDETLKPLPVMPLTMCMEIMAEVAALLMPGKVLTGMRRVQGRQWMGVGAPITLEITARKGSSGEDVEVEIRKLSDADEAKGSKATAAVEGIVTFGDAYPESPPTAPLVLTAERPCRYTAEQMYEEGLMFHGPRFRGVVSLDRSGENGIVGQIEALPQNDLFRSATDPSLLTDPVLLDCAGQMLGYWAAEHLDTGYVVFPFRLSALEVYGPNPGAHERVRCELEIQQLAARQLCSTISLFIDGRLRLRLSGWEDWRFFWPNEFYNFSRFPRTHLLTKSWETPLSQFPRGAFACHRIDSTPEITEAIIAHTMPYLILSRTERREWASLATPEIRRTEWLFGKAVAKDAVRRLLKARCQIDVYPADVEIGHDQDGCPFASFLGLDESVTPPSISIAHSDGLVVAVAGYCASGHRLGIDVERIRSHQEAFQKIAFSGAELTLLDSLPDPARDEWVTRLWCAKEAAAKALGKGLVEGPRSSLTVQTLDPSTGMVKLVLGKRLARELPELAGIPLLVYTALEADWVVASTLCELG